MSDTAALADLAVEVRQADATRHDPVGQALLATVRRLAAGDQAKAVGALPFWDQMAVARLFAWNLRDASEWSPALAAKDQRKHEALLVARIVCRHQFSRRRDACTQAALDEHIAMLRDDPKVLRQALAYKSMPVEERHAVASGHAADFFARLIRHHHLDIPLPQLVIGDPNDGDGDMGRHRFHRATRTHEIRQFYGQNWDTLFDRIGCMNHEFAHVIDDEAGLLDAPNPAVMTERDRDLAHLSSHNEHYGLYLDSPTYTPVPNRLQAVERMPWQITYTFNELRRDLLGIALPRRHGLGRPRSAVVVQL